MICEKRQESGFTLIEVVVSLVLAAIMATVAGMGLVAFAKGFAQAKQSTHTAQKTQLAMTRLARELMELTSIMNGSGATTILLESKTGTREIGLNDNKIKIAKSPTVLANGDVLIDNVASFNLAYYKDYQADPKQSWTPGTDDIDLLTAIRFEFILSGVGNSFSTIVFPRNK